MGRSACCPAPPRPFSASLGSQSSSTSACRQAACLHRECGASDFNDRAEPYANRQLRACARSRYRRPQASVFIHSGSQSGNPL